MRTALAVSTLAILTGTAAADPGTFTLDRQDAQSRVGGEISYLLLDDADDVTVLRFDIHGQYVTPSGFGFYAAIPIAYATGNDDSVTGIGDIDLGAIFIPKLSSPQVSLPIHAGLTMPTAGDDIDDFFVNFTAANARITDLVLAIPEGLTLRAAVSPTFRSGQFFLKADAGIDIPLSQSGDGEVDPLIRLNAAAGIDLGNVSFAGELVNLISTDDDANDQVFNTVAVGVRGVAGGVRPYGGVIVPIDADGLDAVFTAGLEGVIQ